MNSPSSEKSLQQNLDGWFFILKFYVCIWGGGGADPLKSGYFSSRRLLRQIVTNESKSYGYSITICGVKIN